MSEFVRKDREALLAGFDELMSKDSFAASLAVRIRGMEISRSLRVNNAGKIEEVKVEKTAFTAILHAGYHFGIYNNVVAQMPPEGKKVFGEALATARALYPGAEIRRFNEMHAAIADH